MGAAVHRKMAASACEHAGWHRGEPEKGTPQGSVVSPVLANLFLHYAFDCWMSRNHPDIPFERYADDVICHCRSEAQKRVRCATRSKRG